VIFIYDLKGFSDIRKLTGGHATCYYLKTFTLEITFWDMSDLLQKQLFALLIL